MTTLAYLDIRSLVGWHSSVVHSSMALSLFLSAFGRRLVSLCSTSLRKVNRSFGPSCMSCFCTVPPSLLRLVIYVYTISPVSLLSHVGDQ